MHKPAVLVVKLLFAVAFGLGAASTAKAQEVLLLAGQITAAENLVFYELGGEVIVTDPALGDFPIDFTAELELPEADPVGEVDFAFSGSFGPAASLIEFDFAFDGLLVEIDTSDPAFCSSRPPRRCSHRNRSCR